MAERRLQTRFVLAGTLFVTITVTGAAWSAWMFSRLSRSVGATLEESQARLDFTAKLAATLERADDALLLGISGETLRASDDLKAERQRFDELYTGLVATLAEAEEKHAASDLLRDSSEYRKAADALLASPGTGEVPLRYHRDVNPFLRRAVADCSRLRELQFRSMQHAGVDARNQADRATTVLAILSLASLAISGLIAVSLARSVVRPIERLTHSVDAIRAGDFEQRVPIESTDELGRLAQGFNRMAEALGEFRRSNLHEIVLAKRTLEATLAALPDAVIVGDATGRVVSLNAPARRLLEAVKQKVPARLDELALPPGGVRALRNALTGQQIAEARAQLDFAFSVDVGDRTLKLLPLVVPIFDPESGQSGSVVVLYDVTDFVRLDLLRSELIAVASHELRTPLTAFRLSLLVLGETAGEMSPRQREMLETAKKGCETLGNIVEEFLDLARIESGQLRLNLESVDVQILLEQILASWRPRFADAGVRLELAPAPSDSSVRCDPARLRHVFSNLLDNALKYTPQGGSVTLAVSFQNGRDGSTVTHQKDRTSSPHENAGSAASGAKGRLRRGHAHVEIAVTDTGPGVPAEFRERIFEKFFRVEHHLGAKESREVKGTGFGLYLCRQIVEAHEGGIWCEAASTGGARFVIALPAAIVKTP